MVIAFTKILDQNLELIKDISNNPIVWEFFPDHICSASRRYDIFIGNYSEKKYVENYSNEKNNQRVIY